MADVGNLTAKLTLDTTGFSKGAGEAEGLAKKLAGGIGNALGGVAAGVTAAVGAAAAGVTALVKEAATSFADYEQLVGGVETLFKDSAGIVEDYAMNAYKTAGISANEYMQTVTSFSASLLQSLGGNTEQAAQIADMAITDMADNANKMGTDMTAIQNAYQGFAKQNYTMLDNLKLGYGGTKEEMERLLQDAEKLTGIKYDIKNLSDVYNAIHAIQTELGITGTTAEEAQNTISGSLNMMKSAWQDLLTSLAGGGKGLSEAIDDLVESAEAFLANIIPVIEEALYGIGDLIMQITPIIAERLPELIGNLVPMLIETGVYLVNALIESLPSLISTIAAALLEVLPSLVDAIVAMINALLTDILPILAELAINIVIALAQNLGENAQMLTEGVITLILTLLQLFVENLPIILEAGLTIILGIVDGILYNLHNITDAIVQMIVTVVTTIIEHLPEILMAAIEIGAKIVAGIVMAIPNLITSVGRMIGIVDSAKDSVTASTSAMNNDVNSTLKSMAGSLSAAGQNTAEASANIRNRATDLNVNVKAIEKDMNQSFGRMVDIVDLCRDKVEFILKDMSRILTEEGSNMSISMANLASSFSMSADSIASSCYRMADAARDALDALNRLASARVSSGGFGGGHASGGYVSAGTTYLVGELGPELITPTRSGYVHTAEETADMLGGSGDIYITIQGDVYDDEYSMRNKLRDAMLDVLEEQLAYG